MHSHRLQGSINTAQKGKAEVSGTSPSHPPLYTLFPHPPHATVLRFLGKMPVVLCATSVFLVPPPPMLVLLPSPLSTLPHLGTPAPGSRSSGLRGFSHWGRQQELGEQKGRRAGLWLGRSFVAHPWPWF